MTYEETIELESNIKIKNKANEIFDGFMKNVKLDLKSFKDGRFKLWSDSHNAVYLSLENDVFVFQCRFLHETYDVKLTHSAIFSGLKNKNRIIDHLETYSKGRF